MRIWFDTEFQENGHTIDLISIGLVREDGKTLYLESASYDPKRATPWLHQNVLPHLNGLVTARDAMAEAIVDFAGEAPEFWAYYGAYDWVVLCQIYGTMMDLPKGWPMFVRDVKQLCVSVGNPQLPEQVDAEHNALADALWTKEAWEFLQQRKAA